MLWTRRRRSRGRSGHCAELDDSYADRTLQVPEKTQYATAALVRHLGGSMVVRAADQLQWDVGEPRLYGSAVVRGATPVSTGSGATTYGDDERSPGLHHLTARVYPPLLDYCVGGATSGHQLYCRAACSCDSYSPGVGSVPDYVSAAAGSRRRVHDLDCAARLRSVTAPVGGGDATSLYGVGAPPKRRRHRGSDAGETTPSGRQQAGDASRSPANTQPVDAVVARSVTSDGATSPTPPASVSTSAGGNYTVPELVTDCSLATNASSHGVHGTVTRPLYAHSSS